MVSRRNYFSICIMMATILILFQFSVLIRDFSNNFGQNEYLTETEFTRDDAWNAWSAQLAGNTVQTVVYLGHEDDAAANVIRQWCSYRKMRFEQYDSLENYVCPEYGDPVLLCLTGEIVATAAQADMLSAMVQAGQHVLFCDMPETAHIMQQSKLQSLLGIREVVQEQVELTGVKLFSGFLLGGETIYQMEEEEEKLNQEIELFAPWFLRLSGTKVYMVGMLEDEGVDNEDLPPLIWRNSCGKGRVFVINGPYMQDETGLGILSAVLYELQDYDLYPVVNAQNLSVVNFPVLTPENTEEMMEIYARDLSRLQDSLIWPGLIAATNKGNYKMTSFLTPRLDYSAQDALSADDLAFYLRQFREQDAEAGFSLDHLPGIGLADKLAVDQDFFDSSDIPYSYGAAYVGSGELEDFLAVDPLGVLEHVHTITGDWENTDLLSYCTDTTVAQRMTADAFVHTWLQDLRVKAAETTLAYSNIALDMKCVIWPEEDEPHWEVLSEKFASNINTYWNAFTDFDKTTLSESDKRVRAFFAVDYSNTRQGDTIMLELTGGGDESWFILRTHTEDITDMTGGDYTELEEDVYLIHVREKDLQIELEARENKRYYLP